jgi:hypothetical protein
VRVSTEVGELSVEADTIDELKVGMDEVGFSSRTIERLLSGKHIQTAKSNTRDQIHDSNQVAFPKLFELDSNGYPHVLVSLAPLNARETIGLLLSAKDPSPTSLGELSKIVATNWKNVGLEYLSAVLSQLKQYIIKEGEKGTYTYRLSGAGRTWIKDIILPKLDRESNRGTQGA